MRRNPVVCVDCVRPYAETPNWDEILSACCLEDVLLQHLFVQRLGLLNKQSYSINRLCSCYSLIFNLRLEKWAFVRLEKDGTLDLKKKKCATLRPYRLDSYHCRHTCNVNWTCHNGHGNLGLLKEPDIQSPGPYPSTR